ncbi:Disulfide bond formation protein D [bacterium HR29]|jgi:protein-disulfide isomerase|nr:Disulfide bond formation protein D [bacterium HR29]
MHTMEDIREHESADGPQRPALPEQPDASSVSMGRELPLWTAFLTPAAVLIGAFLIGAVLWIRLDGDESSPAPPELGGFTSIAPDASDGAPGSASPRTLLDAFLGYAGELGLDAGAFRQCLADGSKSEVIGAQYQRGLQLEVTGTPTFFINNKKVVGAQPAAVFDEVIAAELRGSPSSLDAYSDTIRRLAESGRFAIVDSVPDISDAPIEGSRDAKVIIAEFSDFQCPFCKQWVERYLPSLRQRLGDDIALAYLHFPIQQVHPNAPYAALASICAGEQGKFWPMHDLLFQRQDEWASLPLN